MKILVAGVGGTFMGSLAQMLKEAGDEVIGCDHAIYPPMSEALEKAQIPILDGYKAEHLSCKPDLVLIGNALSRGNPLVEAILDNRIPYDSGPGYLRDKVLKHKQVIAVTGTHGKTTTTSILTWILECAGENPSYLIGGVPDNFSSSSRLTSSKYFVIEGDEYDTAFFDKRPKMLVYRPDHIIINHLEYDHADIYDDFAAIKKQFHHLIRLIAPQNNIIAVNKPSINEVLAKGCWSKCSLIETPSLINNGFEYQGIKYCWGILGEHMAQNAAAAISMALELGITTNVCQRALESFGSVKRRLELVKTINGTDYYDDFAHHPTAILQTINALKSKYTNVAGVCDLRSNSMRMGVHKDSLKNALQGFDQITVLADDDLSWPVEEYLPEQAKIVHQSSELQWKSALSCFVLMSNGGLSKEYREALADQMQ